MNRRARLMLWTYALAAVAGALALLPLWVALAYGPRYLAGAACLVLALLAGCAPFACLWAARVLERRADSARGPLRVQGDEGGRPT